MAFLLWSARSEQMTGPRCFGSASPQETGCSGAEFGLGDVSGALRFCGGLGGASFRFVPRYRFGLAGDWSRTLLLPSAVVSVINAVFIGLKWNRAGTESIYPQVFLAR